MTTMVIRGAVITRKRHLLREAYWLRRQRHKPVAAPPGEYEEFLGWVNSFMLPQSTTDKTEHPIPTTVSHRATSSSPTTNTKTTARRG